MSLYLIPMIIFLSLNLNNYLFSIYKMEQKKKDLDMGISSEKKCYLG